MSTVNKTLKVLSLLINNEDNILQERDEKWNESRKKRKKTNEKPRLKKRLEMKLRLLINYAQSNHEKLVQVADNILAQAICFNEVKNQQIRTSQQQEQEKQGNKNTFDGIRLS